MDSFQLHQISRLIVKRDDSPVSLRAIKGVLRNAQEGELPLFAWTLGLSQIKLIQMLRACIPEVEALEPLSDRQYQSLLETTPADFFSLRHLLLELRSPEQNVDHIDWLARAIAAATQGSRHLWEDLGLNSRDEVSQLLQQYFEPLYRQNTQNWKWKRFIYAQLGAAQGKPGLQPPKCMKCDEFAVCFPLSGNN